MSESSRCGGVLASYLTYLAGEGAAAKFGDAECVASGGICLCNGEYYEASAAVK